MEAQLEQAFNFIWIFSCRACFHKDFSNWLGTNRQIASAVGKQLCCVLLCCVTLRCVTLCCVVLCCVVLCCAVLCYVVLCCVVLCCGVLCGSPKPELR